MAGDYFSLAVWAPQWTASSGQIPWLQGIFPAFSPISVVSPHASTDNFASFSSFAPTWHQKAQGIFDRHAGNLESRSSEFSLAQRALPEPWLGYEEETAATAGISYPERRNRVRTPTNGNTLESGPIWQPTWPTPKTQSHAHTAVRCQRVARQGWLSKASHPFAVETRPDGQSTRTSAARHTPRGADVTVSNKDWGQDRNGSRPRRNVAAHQNARVGGRSESHTQPHRAFW